MKSYIALPTAIALSCSKSLIFRGVSVSKPNRRGFWFVNAVSFAVATLALAAIAACGGGLFENGRLKLSLATFLLAVPFALCTLGAQIFYIAAQGRGSVSLNTFLYSCGFIVPVVYGVVALHEAVKITQIAGLIVLIGAMYLYLLPKKGRFDKLWLALISAASLLSGAVGVLQKVQQNSAQRAEADGFLIVTFALCAAISCALAIAFKPACEVAPASAGNDETADETAGTAASETAAGEVVVQKNTAKAARQIAAVGVSVKEAWLAVASGAVAAALNRVNLSLAGALPSMIFYPVFNGAVTLATGVAAFLICKEKLNLRQWLSLLLGIAAIALIAE